MSGPKLLALELATPVLEAEEELKGPVSDTRLYDLVLKATGSVGAAEASLRERLETRLRRGETPDI